MRLSNSFTTVFEKSQKVGNSRESDDKWVITEHDKGANMTRLEVYADGKFLGFTNDLVKGVTDTTTKMSSKLEDKDCDGIAFLNDNSEHEHLIFAELKSKFSTERLQGAYHQIIMSFIKMHAWLSLCKGYNLNELNIHFIAACKCFENEDQKDSVMQRISKAQLIEEPSFEKNFLKQLLKNHYIKVKLSNFEDIKKLPFHEHICDKEVIMYLQLTDNYSDDQAKVSLSV